MTDEQVNQIIAKFLGECYHDPEATKIGEGWEWFCPYCGDFVGWSAVKDGFDKADVVPDYLTWEGFGRVWEKAKEDERWDRFLLYAFAKYGEINRFKWWVLLIGPQFVRVWAEFIGEEETEEGDNPRMGSVSFLAEDDR